MNFFFGIKHNKIYSSIKIPRFQNTSGTNKDFKLYQATIENKMWKINRPEHIEYQNFFFLDKEIVDNEKIFFLARTEELNSIKKNNFKKIFSLNSFTDTHFAYRANLEVIHEDGGFSSFQSEYPSSMINRNSSILSSIGSLANLNADHNFLLFKNIYEYPIKEKFDLFIININNCEILEKHCAYTNQTNIIEIHKDFIKPETFIFTINYIGVPIYLSIKNGHLSLEHTHPPYHYIVGKNNFKVANQLKKKVYDKIYKKIYSN